MKYGIIYKHTNKINGKVYIGQTIQIDNLERRWRRSDKTYNSYKSCPAFFNALTKYGWDNFETEILQECSTQDELNKQEEYFINLHNCIAPNGYNTNTICDSGVKYGEETRRKMSQKRKEYFANLTEKPKAINKKEHIFIDSIEHKECAECKSVKLLTEYNVNNRRWDKLHFYCRECSKTKQTKYEKMSKEDFTKSYENRQNAEKQKQIYLDNPGLRAQRSKERSKAVIGTHTETGVEIEFTSAKAASQFGFCNKGISKSIRFGHVHKNHTWRFK